ncbi:hypothetical protein MMC11_007963 [Xylographa trunciseda]|nr:hypothetical protein [Xylographa trunciseda]
MDSISADARLTAAQIHSIIQQALEPLTARIDHQHAQLMIALAQLIPVSYCPEPPTEFKTEAYHQCHAADSASSIVADSGTKQSTECSTLAQNPLRALFDGVEGQRIRIPSVDSLCPSWPVSVNPNLEAVRGEFTAWVNQYDPTLCKSTSSS